MIKAIGIDDEPMPLVILKGYAERTKSIDLIQTFNSTAVAKDWLSHNQVDLLFMDINMPAISGLDFVRKLDSNYMFIFTTAHAEYAVDGFDLNAVDYLLKPFGFERFLQAIDKAQEFHDLRNNKSGSEFFVKSDYSVVKIVSEDISFIEAYSDYLKIHRKDQQTIITRMTMNNILELLSDDFMRIHRSYIVPISKVDALRSRELMVQGHALPVGKTYQLEVKELINRNRN